MQQGIIFIEVRDGEEGRDFPQRAGGFVVIKEEAVRRFVQPEELLNNIVKKRVAFVPTTVWNLIGLNKEDSNANDGEVQS